jgi:hypothetical protein
MKILLIFSPSSHLFISHSTTYNITLSVVLK